MKWDDLPIEAKRIVLEVNNSAHLSNIIGRMGELNTVVVSHLIDHKGGSVGDRLKAARWLVLQEKERRERK